MRSYSEPAGDSDNFQGRNDTAVEYGRPVQAKSYGVYAGGRWIDAADTFASHNPAKPQEVLARFARATPELVSAAYESASEAQERWRRLSPIARGEYLFRAADALSARADPIAEELTREEGKTLREARAEVARSVSILRYFAGEAAQPIGSVLPSADDRTFLFDQREPLGVVCAITPWNFPLAIPAWKIAPALAFGNTVVWKPSELTPLCAVRLVEAFVETGLPAGVLNLVTGLPEDIGDAVTGHPAVDAISFTGSVEVGRAIQAAAVARGVKVQLELGGKNPVVVLEDADLELAVEQTVRGAMSSSGQKCTATSRAIVTPAIRDVFTDRLLEQIATLRVGDPLEESTDLGPLASQRQLERALYYLGVARDEGLRCALGGNLPPSANGGHFVSPTVYVDVPPESRIGQEEIFGPVLAVMTAGSFEEAVEIANSVEYGLSASVFTRDIARALEFVRDSQAGVVHINSETPGAEPQAPFGGMKASSSHSREQGKTAAEFYTQIKTVYLKLPP